MIYHSITRADWEAAQKQNVYTPSSLNDAHYIHTSSLDQLVSITNLVFTRRDDLLILEIDEKKVKADVILEDIKGHGRFAHIYGPLNLDAVVATYPMLTDENPNSKVAFKLPPELIRPSEYLNRK